MRQEDWEQLVDRLAKKIRGLGFELPTIKHLPEKLIGCNPDGCVYRQDLLYGAAEVWRNERGVLETRIKGIGGLKRGGGMVECFEVKVEYTGAKGPDDQQYRVDEPVHIQSIEQMAGFLLLHEAGHLKFGHLEGHANCGKSDLEKEKEANRFAVAGLAKLMSLIGE